MLEAVQPLFLVDGDMGIFSQDDEGYWRKGSKDKVPGGSSTLDTPSLMLK